MEPAALNYNPSASVPGQCTTAVPGCLDQAAANYYSDANVPTPSMCVYPGCADPSASNYNPSANANDGSCTGLIPGCTNPAALNYNAIYTVDDGSCIIAGCTDPSSSLYNAAATYGVACMCTADGCGSTSGRRQLLETQFKRRLQQGACCPIAVASNYEPSCASPCIAGGSFSCCVFGIVGCRDPTAMNYLPSAVSDGPCEYAVYGCTVSTDTLNFDSLATRLGGGSHPGAGCRYAFHGCTDSAASNYVPEANVDDGTCTFDVVGCAEPSALNFDSVATVSAGCTLRIPGCMASRANNYMSTATVPGGALCIFVGCLLPLAANYDPSATQGDASCIVASPPPSPPTPAPQIATQAPAPAHGTAPAITPTIAPSPAQLVPSSVVNGAPPPQPGRQALQPPLPPYEAPPMGGEPATNREALSANGDGSASAAPIVATVMVVLLVVLAVALGSLEIRRRRRRFHGALSVEYLSNLNREGPKLLLTDPQDSRSDAYNIGYGDEHNDDGKAEPERHAHGPSSIAQESLGEPHADDKALLPVSHRRSTVAIDREGEGVEDDDVDTKLGGSTHDDTDDEQAVDAPTMQPSIPGGLGTGTQQSARV